MSGWIWWLLVACGFGVGEVTLTTGFWLAPFSVGALLAALVDAVGVGAPLDFIVFVTATVLALFSLRPIIASRLLQTGPLLRTGAAALVGETAVVTETIHNRDGRGRVRIGSEIWTARAFDDAAEILVGADVHVIEIRGATALVME